MSTGVKNGDVRTMSQYGSSAQYRAQLEWDSDSSTDSTYVLKWTGRAQAQHLSGWGIKVLVEVTGDTSGYSGYTTGSDTGVISYSTSFTTDASVSKTIKIPRGHSSKTVKVKVSAYGVTVDGHTGVTAGTSDYTATFNPGAKPSYTVKYNNNGGTGSAAEQTKWYGESLTLRAGSSMSKTGYTLFGWGTTSTQTEKSYSLEGNYTKNAGDTLYALWKKTITLTYSANGGSGAPNASSYTVYNNTNSHTFTISATKPTRTGYTFLGWDTSSSATSATYSAGDTISLSSNDTLYAVWKKLTYTVSYNPNGTFVTNMPAQQTKNYGSNLTLSSDLPVRSGYNFINWNTAANGSGTSYNRGATYSANANLTLYAQWQVKTYSISYNANEGSNPPATQTKTYGVNLTLTSSIPTRSGYNFTGWNTKSDGTGTSYSPGQVYSVNASITLYARWEEAHQIPKITNLNIIRVDRQGEESDEGEYGRISFDYEFDSSISTGTAFIQYKTSSSSYQEADSITLNGNTGKISNILTQTTGNETTNIEFSQDEAYNISVSVVDSDLYPSQIYHTFLSKAYFIMDIYGQTRYDEINTTSGFPTGITVYEHPYKSIEITTQPTAGIIAFQDTEQTNGRDLFYSQYYLKENYTFTYFSVNNKWYNEDLVSVELNEIGLSYTGDTLDDNSTFTIEIVYDDYVVTEDETPVSNKHYFKQATEPGHGIGFGAPAEYNKFKIGLPVYLPTNMGIYGVNNSNQNAITMPMIQSVSANGRNYVGVGSNNYATHILGSTIDIEGSVETLTVSGTATISSDLKLTKTHSIYLNSEDSSPQNKTRIVAADYLGGNNIYYDAHGYHALRTWDTTLPTPDWSGKFYIYNDHIKSNVPIYINSGGPIGDYSFESHSTNPNPATATASFYQMFSLTAGVYVIYLHADFAGSSTGYRGISIAASTTSYSDANEDAVINRSRVVVGSSGSNPTRVLTTVVVAPSATTYYRARLYQTSGGNLSTPIQYGWVRIR